MPTLAERDLLELHDYYEQQLTLAIAQGSRHAIIHWRIKTWWIEKKVRELDAKHPGMRQ